jgi:mannose-6-phosphate isomerase
MSIKPYPLLFKPVYKSHIWGGNRIPLLFNREHQHGPCAESWEIADRPEGMSVVANGPLAGKSLHDLVTTLRQDLLGSASNSPVFPLLFKILDAKQRLSVQVHPDEKSAAAHGGEPKTEMWYILAAEQNARLFAGLKPGANPESFLKAVEQGHVEEWLGSTPAIVGTAIYMPGGLVHAIGEGCLLIEIQQNSDTTYRVYDWRRVGKDGKPRETHIKQALQAINWTLQPPAATISRKAKDSNGNSWWEVLKSPYFHVSRVEISNPEVVANDGKSFHALFVVGGKARIEGNGVAETIGPGTSCLLPAALKQYTLTPAEGHTTLIQTSLV